MATLVAGGFSLLQACSKDNDNKPQEVNFKDDFSTGRATWQAGFADYPPGNPTYALSDSIAPLPSPLDVTKKGFRISGINRSDDLFMYLKKRIDVKPDTDYEVSFEVTLASDARTGGVGIGGAPGESVGIGAGITLVEPVAELKENGYLRMNIGKIQQCCTDGKDMKVMGNIANGADQYVYKSITRSGKMTFKSDKSGKAWIIVGTDSGYEGLTTLYYQSIKVNLKPVNPTT